MALPEIIKDIDARVIRPTSTDNAIVRFNGTTGQVQNTGNIIDDNNNVTFQKVINSGSICINGRNFNNEVINSTTGGTLFGIEYDDINHLPENGIIQIRGSGGSFGLASHCSYTDGISENIVGKRCFYKNAENNYSKINNQSLTPTALILKDDGHLKYYIGNTKVYSKNEEIIMNEYEVLHTGNISLADSRFVKKSGDTVTGQLIIESTVSNSWNEGIRINTASNGWTSLILGCNKGSIAGTQEGAWSLHTNNGTFYLSHNGSSSGNPMLIGIKNTGFKIQGTLEVTGLITGTVSNADTVDGYHASSLWRSDGGTWNGNANLVCSGSNTEWSIDVSDGGTNSAYFHIWSGNLGNSMIQCWPTTGRVLIPYTLGIGGYDTNYKLYVNGNSDHRGNIRIYTTAQPQLNIQSPSTNTWTYIRLHNGSVLWDIATNTNNLDSALQFRYMGSDSTRVYITSAGVLFGAAWNDYAEYRESDITQPGKCIIENGDDTLRLSTERLQRGAEIVSDTFGFAIGETDICKTPIAASGRVLAYGYEDREQFKSHIGYPVCSGPNGTVSIMTDEEEQLYPSRIIGYISAVPDYEIWGTGNVKVDGRIWIRIK